MVMVMSLPIHDTQSLQVWDLEDILWTGLYCIPHNTELPTWIMNSDIPYRYQAEFDRLISERKHFESSHGQLLVDYEELKERLVSKSGA